jgi:uncharacterized membrane protein
MQLFKPAFSVTGLLKGTVHQELLFFMNELSSCFLFKFSPIFYGYYSSEETTEIGLCILSQM